MEQMQAFTDTIDKAYSFESGVIPLGRAMLNGTITSATIAAPLKTMNRHGLISGATGTGKTKTLQLLAEGLSDASVPVLLLDIKGDMSGIAAKGETNEKLQERCRMLSVSYEPQSYPVELLSLSGSQGVKLKATVTEFGPVLLGKILELNNTQESILSMLFKYCDDHDMPLLDLQDLQKMLQWAANEGKKDLAEAYGSISAASVGTIMRKVIALQQQGADSFFGEHSFETDDLMRIAPDGRGMISIVRVADIQDKPRLFSTFMLQLLSELYATLPEEGDMEQPKLVLFIDEAHLIFNDASDVLVSQLETIIKLIRSKGVGIFFCTQTPTDIAPAVLGQLGLKIQHALRAFTANDRKAIVQAAKNYPDSAFYKTDEIITQLGIGEALITLLDEKGIPTPLAATMMFPPKSRMGTLTVQEIDNIVAASGIAAKYNQPVNRESAYEILTEKLKTAKEETPAKQQKQAAQPEAEKNILETLSENTVVKSMMRTAGNTIVRSLLGSLGIGGRSRKKSSWF